MIELKKYLMDNMDLLHKLSEELLEREILDAEEIDRIIRGEDLPPVQKENKNHRRRLVPDHVKKLMEQRQQTGFRTLKMTHIDNGTIHYRDELVRKLIHLFSLSIPVIYYFIPIINIHYNSCFINSICINCRWRKIYFKIFCKDLL